MDTNKELLLGEEVYAVVGAAMEVHSEMGTGFLEAVYQQSMELELTYRKIPFEAQKIIPIYYKHVLLCKQYVADILCYGRLVVEIKSLPKLTNLEEAQLLNYLKATGLRVGVLLNFGNPSHLEWKRMIR